MKNDKPDCQKHSHREGLEDRCDNRRDSKFTYEMVRDCRCSYSGCTRHRCRDGQAIDYLGLRDILNRHSQDIWKNNKRQQKSAQYTIKNGKGELPRYNDCAELGLTFPGSLKLRYLRDNTKVG